LQSWHPASQSGGQYKEEILIDSPASFKGQSGAVIAIQLHPRLLGSDESAQKVNALGEVVSADQTVDPYFDLVVKLDKDVLITTTGYPATIEDEVKLASDHDAFEKEMAVNLPTVVGKSVYAVGYSRLYQLDATLEEIQSESAILKQLPLTDVPLLEPLQITAAKYNEAANAIILKIKLPNGSEALSVTNTQRLDTKQDSPFLQRISHLLLAAMPNDITSEEVAAIKKRSIFRGMSKTALYYAMGFPGKENDWGHGGKQFIYSDTFFVYVNNAEKIVDWQSLDN
jgi:hypothetical protein